MQRPIKTINNAPILRAICWTVLWLHSSQIFKFVVLIQFLLKEEGFGAKLLQNKLESSYCTFIKLLIHSFIHSFFHSFILSCVQKILISSLVYLFTRSIYPFIHQFINSSVNSFIALFICSFLCPFFPIRCLFILKMLSKNSCFSLN